MQRTIFECDHCKKETTRKGKHISLRLAINSGIAVSPKTAQNDASHWRVMPDLQNKFVHFCNTKCLASYFEALMKQDK